MSYRYDRTCDRMLGHDYPGVHGHGMHRWVLDEIELGARVALAIGDPEQWYWNLMSTFRPELWEAA